MIAVMLVALGILFGPASDRDGRCDATAADTSVLVKLPESFELADYPYLLARGVLFPDRVRWDSTLVKTGMPASQLGIRPDDSTWTMGEPAFRDRLEQAATVRTLLAANNYSMFYYALVPIYYDQQLCGWFKTAQKAFPGLGTLEINLHAKDSAGDYRVWLLVLSCEVTTEDSCRYGGGPGLHLTRFGNPALKWDVSRNRVVIGHSDP